MSPLAQIALGVVVLGGAMGLAIGSFLNVVVYRVPAGLSVVRPASACPKCHSEIRGYDNIPVLSWLLLRGRCRDCAEPISWRYPAVETLTSVLFIGTGLVFAPAIARSTGVAAVAGSVVTLIAFLYLAAITVTLALIDLDVQRLPNAIVLPAYLVAGVLLTAAAGLSGEWDALLRAAIGSAALFLFYFALAFAWPGGMGFGDVKLAGVLGAFLGWLGWPQLVVGTFAAFLLGGVVAVALILARRAGRGSGIPFGPWMLTGAWLSIFAGGPIAAGYLRLVGLG